MVVARKILLTIFAVGFSAIVNITAAGAQPSFDCGKASTRVETMICDHRGLAQLDSDLADAYRVALRDVAWASANKRIRRDQQAWIERRNRCGSAKCLRRLYHQRIGELYAELGEPEDSGGDLHADAGSMMAQCRDRAAQVFHTRIPNVETKYEGQRTDGTHVVNGTAYLRSHSETFQCSFNAAGDAIVQFVVN